MSTRSEQLLERLREAVGAPYVQTDPDLTDQYRRDMQPLAAAGRPLAVVRPRTTAEVAAVLAACSQAGVAVVPRGAGSGMTGAANAQDGAVSLVLTRMTDLEIDADARTASVQPGVVTLDLKKAAAAQDLFYAPDPTSNDWCTIGGNLANGSAGPCGAKYGVTGDAVRSLEVVLASGEVLHTGRRAFKGVTGYDLNRLFVGSEGTLGVITRATLALRPKPAATATCVAAFEELEAAGAAVTTFVDGGQELSLLEIMDSACLAAVETRLGSTLLDDAPTPAAVLFAQSDSGRPDELDAFEAACEAAGAVLTYQTDDPAEGQMLMQYWAGLEDALEVLGTWILHEVTVPRRRLVDLLAQTPRIAAEQELFVGIHGHAADGTVHPMIVCDPDDPDQRRRAQAAYDAILDAAISLGGTVTGEHGIGRMKGAWLAAEVGEVGLSVHRAIKHALDPAGILNPGSMFSPRPAPAPSQPEEVLA
jgi:glycolate oxidase